MGGIFILFLFIVVFVALNIYISRDHLIVRLLLMALIYICLLMLLKSSYMFYFGILLAFVGPAASIAIFFRPALMQDNLKRIQSRFFREQQARANAQRQEHPRYGNYGRQGAYQHKSGAAREQQRQAPPPRPQQAADPYEVLGVTRDMSSLEIRQVFKELVHIYHPDKGKIKSPAKFIVLKDAYETIMRQRNFYKS